MWARVVTNERATVRSVVPHAIIASIGLILVSRAPDMYRDVEVTRGYADPDVKRGYVVVLAVLCAGIALGQLIRMATVVGLFAPLYARAGGGSLTLATPLGVLGVPTERLVVRPGTVQARVEDAGPVRPFYPLGVQHLYRQHHGKRLHVASSVGFAPSSGAELARQVERSGIALEITGTFHALGPSRA